MTNWVTQNLTNNSHHDAGFSWEIRNGYLNNEMDRRISAIELVDYIISYRKKNEITNEEITLIGHSHGGNIAIQAAGILHDRYNISVNIINFNTPAYNGNMDRENPSNSLGINSLRHFYTTQDGVSGGIAAGSDDKY